MPPLIVLRDDSLLVRIDPDHGAEILDLVDLSSDRQLLARTPFRPEPAQGGELSEAAWTRSYRGGWQVLLPNAGNACEANGTQHGFHGRASVDPWAVDDLDTNSATLAWEGHGIRARRRLSLTGGAFRVETQLQGVGDAPAPLVMVEHIGLGLELLQPQAELTLPAASAFELDEGGGPATPPGDAPSWPLVRLGDGRVERADLLALRQPGTRLYSLNGLPRGFGAVRNAQNGQGLALSWDAEWFRHMWVWWENRATGGPWRHAGELLVLEPATVPHHLGLGEAHRLRQAVTLEPGRTVRTWLVARPFVQPDPVRDVGPDARVR